MRPKRPNKHSSPKTEKCSTEIHNVTSNIRGGWVVLNL